MLCRPVVMIIHMLGEVHCIICDVCNPVVILLYISYIITATLVTAAFFIFVVGAGLRAQWLPVRAGRETQLGKTVAAVARIDGQSGKIFVEGEYWNAVSDMPVEPGQPVEIVGI